MRKNFGRIGKSIMDNRITLGCESLENRLMLNASPIDNNLNTAYKQYYADNILSRNEMVAILNNSRDNGVIDSIEFKDLKNIISQSNMPEYVKYFADSIVNGSAANRYFNGSRLGNLLAGSSSDHMSKLIDKWFLGKDRPDLNNWRSTTSYQYITGAIFVNGPTINDLDQGRIGDCYFINALGAVVQSNPSSIYNMILDNGDNTYSLRFINNRTNQTHYVTVDRYLPVNTLNGAATFAGFGRHYTNTNNELWVALLEKGYAQVSQIPGFRPSNSQTINSYDNLNGGFSNVAIYHLIGVKPNGFALNNTNAMITSINTKQPLVISYNNHAYTISSYTIQTRRFHIHNPWGHSHMDLTWSEMQLRGMTSRIAYQVNASFSRSFV